jgi:hypothetical protein
MKLSRLLYPVLLVGTGAAPGVSPASPGALVCPACGKPIEPGMSFCVYDGARGVPVSAPKAAAAPTPAKSVGKPARKLGKLKLAGLITLGLVVVLCGVYWFMPITDFRIDVEAPSYIRVYYNEGAVYGSGVTKLRLYEPSRSPNEMTIIGTDALSGSLAGYNYGSGASFQIAPDERYCLTVERRGAFVWDTLDVTPTYNKYNTKVSSVQLYELQSEPGEPWERTSEPFLNDSSAVVEYYLKNEAHGRDLYYMVMSYTCDAATSNRSFTCYTMMQSPSGKIYQPMKYGDLTRSTSTLSGSSTSNNFWAPLDSLLQSCIDAKDLKPGVYTVWHFRDDMIFVKTTFSLR